MKPLVIGTRASKLARAQAEMLRSALLAAFPEREITFAAMTTAGDREVQKDISDWGYKGLFTKELEDALLDGRVDIAVHSAKDMPSALPEGLVLAGVLERADMRDAWVSPIYDSIEAIHDRSIIGTSSTRRAAQLKHRFPDVTIVPFRGNVDTRLQKLNDGVAEATFLAAAGLKRLGYVSHIRSLIPTEVMLPATAQGIIAMECRSDRSDIREMLAAVTHQPSLIAATAERAYLHALDGSCRTPIGGLAEISGDLLKMRGEVLSLDGQLRYYKELIGSSADAERIGRELGSALRQEAGTALVEGR